MGQVWGSQVQEEFYSQMLQAVSEQRCFPLFLSFFLFRKTDMEGTEKVPETPCFVLFVFFVNSGTTHIGHTGNNLHLGDWLEGNHM